VICRCRIFLTWDFRNYSMDLNLKKRDAVPYQANFGRMQERSVGKDTTTGHWEIAGVIFEEPFALFEKFPEELVEAIERENGIRFIGDYARSGTTILDDLSPEHVRTPNPILYTSADSVLQSYL
jgi:phosphopentomutase